VPPIAVLHPQRRSAILKKSARNSFRKASNISPTIPEIRGRDHFRGDPLMLSDNKIEQCCPDCGNFRIFRFCASVRACRAFSATHHAELVRMLKNITVYINVHLIIPTTDSRSLQSLGRLADAGIPLGTKPCS
jgi:predicted RNA-binding Zn-ribbon protein involved in translation (DUF1610 family)